MKSTQRTRPVHLAWGETLLGKAFLFSNLMSFLLFATIFQLIFPNQLLEVYSNLDCQVQFCLNQRRAHLLHKYDIQLAHLLFLKQCIKPMNFVLCQPGRFLLVI